MTIKQQLRSEVVRRFPAVRRLKRANRPNRADRANRAGVLGRMDRVQQLTHRVEALEHELAESRRLNKRIAEITDIVAEVLLPANQQDPARLRAALDAYADKLHAGGTHG